MAGPDCIFPWSFDSRWIATVCAVSIIFVVGVIQVGPSRIYAKVSVFRRHLVNEARREFLACCFQRTTHGAVIKAEDEAAANGNSAASPRSATGYVRDGLEFAFEASWVLRIFMQQGVPVLLRVSIEALLPSMQNGVLMLYGEPSTRLLAPPHLGVFSISLILIGLVTILIMMPRHKGEGGRGWINWYSNFLNALCTISVAVRVVSQGAAVGFLVAADTLRLCLVTIFSSQLRSELESGGISVTLLYVSGFGMVLLQAVTVICIYTDSCAASSSWAGILFALYILYGALLLSGNRHVIFRTLWACCLHSRSSQPAESLEAQLVLQARPARERFAAANPMHAEPSAPAQQWFCSTCKWANSDQNRNSCSNPLCGAVRT